MTDKFLALKPRTREWFPENISGLYVLSKGEILDDLDFMSGNQDEMESPNRASTRAGKRKLESIVAEHVAPELPHEEPKPSKRSRLVGKVEHERKRYDATKLRYVQLRDNLTELRNEIMNFRDLISHKRRAIEASGQEKTLMDSRYKGLVKDLNQLTRNMTNSRLEYETELKSLSTQVTSEHKKMMDTADSVNTIKILQEDVKMLSSELRARQLKVETLTEATSCLVGDPKKAEEIMLTIVNQKIDGMKVLEQELNEVKNKNQILANQIRTQNEVITQLKSTIAEKTKAQEAYDVRISAIKSNWAAEVELLRKTQDESKVVLDHQININKKCQKQEQLSARMVAVVEKRAKAAEDALQGVIHELNILRSGNGVLQRGYNKLMKQYCKLQEEVASSSLPMPLPQAGLVLPPVTPLVSPCLVKKRPALSALTSNSRSAQNTNSQSSSSSSSVLSSKKVQVHPAIGLLQSDVRRLRHRLDQALQDDVTKQAQIEQLNKNIIELQAQLAFKDKTYSSLERKMGNLQAELEEANNSLESGSNSGENQSGGEEEGEGESNQNAADDDAMDTTDADGDNGKEAPDSNGNENKGESEEPKEVQEEKEEEPKEEPNPPPAKPKPKKPKTRRRRNPLA